jgi:hypothetical protein
MPVLLTHRRSVDPSAGIPRCDPSSFRRSSVNQTCPRTTTSSQGLSSIVAAIHPSFALPPSWMANLGQSFTKSQSSHEFTLHTSTPTTVLGPHILQILQSGHRFEQCPTVSRLSEVVLSTLATVLQVSSGMIQLYSYERLCSHYELTNYTSQKRTKKKNLLG